MKTGQLINRCSGVSTAARRNHPHSTNLRTAASPLHKYPDSPGGPAVRKESSAVSACLRFLYTAGGRRVNTTMQPLRSAGHGERRPRYYQPLSVRIFLIFSCDRFSTRIIRLALA